MHSSNVDGPGSTRLLSGFEDPACHSQMLSCSSGAVK